MLAEWTDVALTWESVPDFGRACACCAIAVTLILGVAAEVVTLVAILLDVTSVHCRGRRLTFAGQRLRLWKRSCVAFWCGTPYACAAVVVLLKTTDDTDAAFVSGFVLGVVVILGYWHALLGLVALMSLSYAYFCSGPNGEIEEESTNEERVCIRVKPAEDGTDAVCAVCLEPATHDALALPCGHVYHGRCIGKWLRVSPRCPQCGTEFGRARQTMSLLSTAHGVCETRQNVAELFV